MFLFTLTFKHPDMSKNIIEAERHRQIGNKLFAKAKYCEALLSYNHSLCFSEDNSENHCLLWIYFQLRSIESTVAYLFLLQ